MLLQPCALARAHTRLGNRSRKKKRRPPTRRLVSHPTHTVKRDHSLSFSRAPAVDAVLAQNVKATHAEKKVTSLPGDVSFRKSPA